MKRRAWWPLLLGMALAGCESSLDVTLTSSPAPAEPQSLVFKLIGVELLDEASARHSLASDSTESIEINDIDDGDTLHLIDNAPLESARYTGLRLRFSTAGGHRLIASDGGEYPVDIGSNLVFADADLDLREEQADGAVLVQFEPRFSLYPSSGDSTRYVFEPFVRVMDMGTVASVGGVVDDDIVQSSACRQGRALAEGLAVYAYAGSGATPSDFVSGVVGGPISSAPVRSQDDGDGYRYSFPYLAAGTYTLALTCDADREDSRVDDGLVFRASANVVLIESQAATVGLSE